MKLGVHIGYWGMGLTSQDQLTIVQEAERLGYDSVWAAEAYGSDTATVLGWLAGQTSKIRLGAGIFQMPGRSPAMTAMTAATIDQLSNGRMICGIGSSGPQVAEGWHGQRFAKQLQRTREYVAVVRIALSRERLEFHGETLELPLPDGPGKDLVANNCVVCHGLDRIAAAKRTESDWDSVLSRMQFMGAPVSADDKKTIAAYLDKNFGSK